MGELAQKICRDLDIPLPGLGDTSVEYRAAIKKTGQWWVGWPVDLPGVNAQEGSKEELIESLKIDAEDMRNSPVGVGNEEGLITIQVRSERPGLAATQPLADGLTHP
ncbi:MAG: hypothetical protein HY673_25510 [Chloroflexi bacterium]|nr:hypothetical protein [Chloroflexota bacterium]